LKHWFINKLEGKKNTELIPYYNGFKGRIFKYDETTWVSEGVLEVKDNKFIIISELPIKLWTSDYKEFLELLVEEKESPFKNYQNLSSDTEINFILQIVPDKVEYINKLYNNIDSYGMKDLYKLLHLYKTIKTSNLTLYDTNWHLKNYKNINEILEDFYNYRLEFYEKRRLKLIETLEDNKEYFLGQIKFINLVTNNNQIFKLDDDKINKYLKENNIKKYNDSYDYIINLTFKQLNKLNLEKISNKIKELNKRIKELNINNKKDLWLNDINQI
jgi:DNA topoisomerase-2